ncbi:MAG: hypothetical protein ABI790_02405 [Betaproteobacteria bacterium]
MFELLLDDIVVPLAGRLPLLAIPELDHVAAVRLDVIDDLRGGDAADGLAAQAQRMRSLEAGGGEIPLPGVATLARAAALIAFTQWMRGAAALIGQGTTAGRAAGAKRCIRHVVINEKPEGRVALRAWAVA